MVQTEQIESENSKNSQIRLCEIIRTSGSCGFNLTKSKWDPYPWVSNVECGSAAECAGVQPGDCLLEVNGEDVLGLRVVEVANKVKARDERVTVMLWNSGVDSQCSPETLCCGPMPTNLQRLSTCMSNIIAALECPVCLDTIPSPAYQCVNGHLICHKCRIKTEKCPVCRIKLCRGRSLLADQIYNSLIDAFDLRGQEESKRRKILKEKLFGQKNVNAKRNKPDIKVTLLNSPTSKFLNKLIRSGKCSSAENLTMSNSADKNSKLLNPLDELHTGLRAKSLSSNEIFRIENQSLSATTSVLSSRPGSGLLDVQPVIYSKRPASYHGSVEELQKKLVSDFGNYDPVQQRENDCQCPCDPMCQTQLNSNSILKHIQEYHEGPVLHFFKPFVELSLPLSYKSSTVLLATLFNTVFIIKILDYTFKSESNRLWIWSVNNNENFTAYVAIKQKDHNTVTFSFPVVPIESVGWQQITNENLGILLSDQEDNIQLTIEIAQNNLN